MEQSYTSVTGFFSDWKSFLVGKGMTVSREVVPGSDVVFDTGSGFFRLRHKTVSPSIAAIGWAFGADPDVLAIATLDCERFVPFSTAPGAAFAPGFHWEDVGPKLLLFVQSMTACAITGPRYRINVDFGEKTSVVRHEWRQNPQFEPNFKDTGGTYISAGA